jgi:uncharacterized BrkB/YihY/UPF0761 family membrane protein
MQVRKNNPIGIIISIGVISAIVTGLSCYTLMRKTDTPIDKVRNDLNLIRLTLLIGLLAIGAMMIYGAATTTATNF